jgi:hypothetical protein
MVLAGTCAYYWSSDLIDHESTTTGLQVAFYTAISVGFYWHVGRHVRDLADRTRPAAGASAYGSS